MPNQKGNNASKGPQFKGFRKYFLLVAFGVLLYQLLEHWAVVWEAVRWAMDQLSPIAWGVAIAFVVNQPMRFFEKLFVSKKRKPSKVNRLRRPLSMILAYLVLLAVIAGLFVLLIPRIVDSLTLLAENIESYYQGFSAVIGDSWNNLNLPPEIITRLQTIGEAAVAYVDGLLEMLVPALLSLMVSLPSGIVRTFFAFILSVYILYNKEKLREQSKAFIRAVFASKSERILKVAAITNQAFNRFIVGQTTEALILGCLIFLGMRILDIPYALLVSVVMAVTALVPVLGAYAGTIASALLIVIIEPYKALLFLLLEIILQQLESNIIYPRVVGNAMGLRSIWVLLAVIVGGGFFGLTGIILGVPLMAVAYRLVGDWVREKNAQMPPPEDMRKDS